jgi:hypothetical protein
MSTTTGQAQPLPPHTPGAGAELLRELWGEDRIPKISDEVRARTAEILAEAERRTRHAA